MGHMALLHTGLQIISTVNLNGTAYVHISTQFDKVASRGTLISIATAALL